MWRWLLSFSFYIAVDEDKYSENVLFIPIAHVAQIFKNKHNYF